MIRFDRLFERVAVALAFVAVASHAAAAQRRRASDEQTRIDTTFSFEKNGSVTVSANSGSITIVGWSRDQVHVRGGGSQSIRVDGSSNRMTLNISGRRGDGSVEVSVPVGVRVNA